MDHMRKHVIETMEASIGAESWKKNIQFVEEIKSYIHQHPVNFHPVAKRLEQCEYSMTEMQRMHMEYRVIVKIFTDALIQAQFKAADLDQQIKTSSKCLPRFLLTLNVLDEFGFQHNAEPNNSYFAGSPLRAHLVLFEELISSLDISPSERLKHRPSVATARLKQEFLFSYQDFLTVVLYLSIAERIVVVFSPLMRKNTSALGVPTEEGYYAVHGVSDDLDNEGQDDYHEDDLFLIMAHALKDDEDRERLFLQCEIFLDAWQQFWSQGFSDETHNKKHLSVEEPVA